MKSYRIFLTEDPRLEDHPVIRFDCQADDIRHAIEQAESAYPEGGVVSAFEVGDIGFRHGCLQAFSTDDYDFVPKRGYAWLTMGNASIFLLRGPCGLHLEVYPLGQEDGEPVEMIDVAFRDLVPKRIDEIEALSVHARRRHEEAALEATLAAQQQGGRTALRDRLGEGD